MTDRMESGSTSPCSLGVDLMVVLAAENAGLWNDEQSLAAWKDGLSPCQAVKRSMSGGYTGLFAGKTMQEVNT